MEAKLIVGVVLIIVGVLFLFGNREIGEWMFKFYRVVYTRKNLVIMFKVAGMILFVGGLILMIVG